MPRNPYYIGIVRYRGAEQSDTDEPLVDIETWQQVQRLLGSRMIAAVRQCTHDHYLKGSLFCGQCGSRMQLDYPASATPTTCAPVGPPSGRTVLGALCRSISPSSWSRSAAEASTSPKSTTQHSPQVEAAFDEQLASRSQELAELTENRKRLQDESDKLLSAHLADTIDLETLKRHQDLIRAGLVDIDPRLASEHDQHEGSCKHLAIALSLLVDCATLYARTDDQGKRFAHQALTNGIKISEDERTTIQLAEPLAALAPEPTSSDVRCSSTSEIVDLMEHYGNRRPRVERLVSAWNQGVREDAEAEDGADDPLIGASAEPKKRPRTRLTDTEVDAMRTALDAGISVKAVARQFEVHRGTVWAKRRMD